MIKVKAVSMGVYKNHPYNVGEVFEVEDEFFADASQGRFGWMVRAEEPKPEVKPVSKPEPVVVQHTPAKTDHIADKKGAF